MIFILKRITFSVWIILFFSFCSSPFQGIIVLCAGDSITEASYPRYLQKILKKEGIKAKVLNYGLSGYTSGEYLNFLEKNKNKLAAHYPDFVLLQLGTNDVRVDFDLTQAEQFYQNMKKIISVFYEFEGHSNRKIRILLATIPPIPEASFYPWTSESRRRVEDEINPLIKKICREEQLDLVDNYSLFLRSPHFLPEVHPSKEGYKKLAQNWYLALKPLLTQ